MLSDWIHLHLVFSLLCFNTLMFKLIVLCNFKTRLNSNKKTKSLFFFLCKNFFLNIWLVRSISKTDFFFSILETRWNLKWKFYFLFLLTYFLIFFFYNLVTLMYYFKSSSKRKKFVIYLQYNKSRKHLNIEKTFRIPLFHVIPFIHLNDK